MHRNIPLLFLAVFGLLLLGGCARIEERKQSDLLTTTLRAYESTVRWGDLARAYGFRDPHAEIQKPPPGLDEIRVVSYATVVAPVLLDEDTARQSVEISYYWQSEQAIRKITDEQAWTYNHEDKLWYLKTEVPTFR